MSTLAYPHVNVSPDGIPYITGTQTKVIEVVLDRLAYHWDADEIHRQHPYLSLGQIYSTLAYYYDHQAEMDREIDKQLLEVEKIKKSLGESSIRLQLQAMGRLP
jgi:uncharacterized protein (DUF433 family)